MIGCGEIRTLYYCPKSVQKHPIIYARVELNKVESYCFFAVSENEEIGKIIV